METESECWLKHKDMGMECAWERVDRISVRREWVKRETDGSELGGAVAGAGMTDSKELRQFLADWKLEDITKKRLYNYQTIV